MRTKIVIDNSLMRQVLRATGLSTVKAVVEECLGLLIKARWPDGIRRLRGKMHLMGMPQMLRWENSFNEGPNVSP
ncbi:MAG: type II toxin-antitoxin system VapB family antitoxin [Nitrospirota bacterium]